MLRLAAPVVSLLACAPAVSPVPAPVAAPAPASAPREREPERPPPATVRCTWADAAPTEFPALVAADAGACRSLPKKARAELHEKLRARWSRQWRTGTLEVRDGCDRMGELGSIVLQTSGGHGGSLVLARFDRRDDGEFDLLLLQYNHYADRARRDLEDPYQKDSAGTLEIFRARLAASAMAPVVDTLRAAAHVEIVEREPPPKPGSVLTSSGSYSSNDYHVALRITDAQGRGTQRYFAGYAGSGEHQQDGVPLAIAREAAWALLADPAVRAGFQPVPATDPAARELFAQAFWHARARGDDWGYWYVRERLLGMAALLGGDEHVPALLAQLRITGEASVDRSRVLALSAIAAITGHDRRYEDARPRPVENAIVDTLAACERPSPPPATP